MKVMYRKRKPLCNHAIWWTKKWNKEKVLKRNNPDNETLVQVLLKRSLEIELKTKLNCNNFTPAFFATVPKRNQENWGISFQNLWMLC